ncbi:adenine phosphoribosyltransferase [Halospeciosus flavus]|uniref:Adenine phosphoribosyltransferase n=1 Tax=Halospeciosus flavus TaxID=3032283 RepID=A0ABD5Z0R8_9EURY|nr:adenine phosphoribosyltransferase [Halospeciosus flavus]
MKRLLTSVEEAPVVERDGYHYLVHPISNGLPTLDPALIREVVNGIVETTALEDVDKIVSPVTMGIHVAAAVSLVTDIPLVVVRDREYGLPGEASFERPDGETLYVNDVQAGDRVLVLDDLVSTGESLAAVVEALADVGAEVVDVSVVVRRVDTDTVLTDLDVSSLVDVHVHADGAEVVDIVEL